MDCFELLRKQTDVVLEAPDLADLFDALVIRVRLHVSPADPAHSPLTFSLTAHACDVRATLRQANAFLSQQWRPAMPSATISLVCRCARCPVVTLTTDQCCHRFFVSLSLSRALSRPCLCQACRIALRGLASILSTTTATRLFVRLRLRRGRAAFALPPTRVHCLQWVRQAVEALPSKRGGHQMCMDSRAGVIYLLGGWEGHVRRCHTSVRVG